MAGKRWTKEEEEKLTELVPLVESVEEVAKELPDRTKSSIQTKIERLGLKLKGQRIEWTEEEEQLLREHYPNCSEVKEIMYLFPKRTEQSVKRKADRIRKEEGIELNTTYKWNKEDTDFLIKNCNFYTNEELAELIGKTKSSIINRLNETGTKRSKEYRSKAQTAENNHFYGHKHKKETKDILIVKWAERKLDPNWKHPWTGREHSKESKETISKQKKEWYKKNNHPMLGKNHSEQSKQNMRVPHHMTKESSDSIRRAVMERNPFGKHIKYEAKNGNVINLDSSYELRIAVRLDELNYDWERNKTKVRIQWFDENNDEHYYYPDFIIWYNGEIYIVEAKGEHLLELYSTTAKAKAAEEEFGKRFLMVSDKEISNFEQNEWFN